MKHVNKPLGASKLFDMRNFLSHSAEIIRFAAFIAVTKYKYLDFFVKEISLGPGLFGGQKASLVLLNYLYL